MPLTPADDSEFDWIKDAGGFPASERAICVLHIMAEDLSIQDHSLTWARWAEESGAKDRELDQLRSQSPSGEVIARALANAESVGGVPAEGAPLRRILWREIAERHGLDVQEMVDLWAIWRSLDRKLGGVPRYLVGTDREGRIDDRSPMTCWFRPGPHPQGCVVPETYPSRQARLARPRVHLGWRELLPHDAVLPAPPGRAAKGGGPRRRSR